MLSSASWCGVKVKIDDWLARFEHTDLGHWFLQRVTFEPAFVIDLNDGFEEVLFRDIENWLPSLENKAQRVYDHIFFENENDVVLFKLT